MMFALRIAAELTELSTLRQFVQEAGASLRLPRSVTDPLVLAVDELAVNIIQHGYRGRPGSIEVEIEQTQDAVIARLRDQAPPFDPTCLPEPDVTLPLERRPVGGMGVYLARRSVDSMSHEVTGQGGNQVTLVKKTVVP
jgi:serine/threonine-protein kinase RsbW